MKKEKISSEKKRRFGGGKILVGAGESLLPVLPDALSG